MGHWQIRFTLESLRFLIYSAKSMRQIVTYLMNNTELMFDRFEMAASLWPVAILHGL